MVEVVVQVMGMGEAVVEVEVEVMRGSVACLAMTPDRR